MARFVEIFFDLDDPACHPARAHIEAVALPRGAVLAWRPVEGRAVRAAAGTPGPSPVTPDLEARAAALGLTVAAHPGAPLDTHLAQRYLIAAEERGHLLPLLRRLSAGIWEQGADPTDRARLAALGAEAGIPGRRLLERAASGHVAQRLAANTAEAVRKGIRVLPTVLLGDRRLEGLEALDGLEEVLDG